MVGNVFGCPGSCMEGHGSRVWAEFPSTEFASIPFRKVHMVRI